MPTYETGNVIRNKGGEKMGGYKELAILLKEVDDALGVVVDLHTEMTVVLSEVNKRHGALVDFLYERGGE